MKAEVDDACINLARYFLGHEDKEGVWELAQKIEALATEYAETRPAKFKDDPTE
jgi:hypothetical protein